MDSAGLVAISLIFGVMLVVILGGMAALILMLLHANRKMAANQSAWETSVENMSSEFDRFLGLISDQFSFQQEEQERFDGERSAEQKSLQSSVAQFRTEIRGTLEAHRKLMDEKLAALNAPALQAASVNIVKATREIAQAASLLQDLVVNQEERESNESGLEPEEYAPDGRSSVYQSETAFTDAQIEREGDPSETEGPASRIHETEGVLA